MATDAVGNVFVADTRNHRIQKFGPAVTATQSSTWGRLKSLHREFPACPRRARLPQVTACA